MADRKVELLVARLVCRTVDSWVAWRADSSVAQSEATMAVPMVGKWEKQKADD
jgi:hypothetical protein